MRIIVNAASRIGNCHLFHGLDCGSACLFARKLAMESEGLGNLFTNSEDGIERSHRILEDHRDVVPADLPHLLIGQSQQVLAIEDNLATDNLSRRRSQSHYGK